MKRACRIHDQVNLVLLPILGLLTVAGLFNWVDPLKVTILFIWYILADFTWIFVERDAVPSMPNIILTHHFVTFVLLCFPLRYPHLARYTCWDGICEINTFFLIARRQWRSVREPFSFLYWATFFPMRIFLYPLMLVYFYQEMQVHALWELVAVCGSQIALIGFNIILLSLSIANWRKRSGTAWSPQSPSAAPVGERSEEHSTGTKIKASDASSVQRVIKAQAAHVVRMSKERS